MNGFFGFLAELITRTTLAAWRGQRSAKKRNEELAEAFTNPPADAKNALPLDPESDPWRK